MNSPLTVDFLTGPEGFDFRKEELRFRLIYDGPLQPSQRDPENGQEDPVGVHKNNIRMQFHEQLKKLWETNKFLSEHKVFPGDYDFGASKSPAEVAPGPAITPRRIPMVEAVAGLYERGGVQMVPLVRDDWNVTCELDILFLRRDTPGGVIQAGDLDNRIKTLIDALRPPSNKLEMPPAGQSPNPLFCLMEDDKQVTALRVETDDLLDPKVAEGADNRRVHLVVSVTIRPYFTTMFNLGFGG